MKLYRSEIIRNEALRAAALGKHVLIASFSRDAAERYRDKYFPDWFVVESDNAGSVEALRGALQRWKTYGISNINI